MPPYKAIFIADLHMNNSMLYSVVVENGITDRLKHQLSVFDHMYEVAKKEGVEDIFIVGDIFDRSLVDAVTLTHTVEAISKTPVPIRIVAGNHDAASSKGGRFTVEAFGAMGNESVSLLHGQYSPKKWLKFTAIPFMPVEETKKEINKYDTLKKTNKEVNVLLFHNSVLGCDHLEWTCDDGLDPEEMLKRFDYAIGGHFHKHQIFGPRNAGMYCGAPLHHNFGDKDRDAGFWLITFTKNGMVKKFIRTKCPKFHLIKRMVKDDSWSSGDYVRLEVECTAAEWTEKKPIAEKFCSGVVGVNIHYKHKPVYHHKKRLTTGDDSGGTVSLLDALKSYVDSGDVVSDGLDVDELKRIGNEVFLKVRSENGIV
jgi:DNA repair exonuclease SbcCD nuclease subunit